MRGRAIYGRSRSLRNIWPLPQKYSMSSQVRLSGSKSAGKFSSTENSSLAESSFASDMHSSSSSSRPPSSGPTHRTYHNQVACQSRNTCKHMCQKHVKETPKWCYLLRYTVKNGFKKFTSKIVSASSDSTEINCESSLLCYFYWKQYSFDTHSTNPIHFLRFYFGLDSY